LIAAGGRGGERGLNDALLDECDLGVLGVAANRPLGNIIPERLMLIVSEANVSKSKN